MFTYQSCIQSRRFQSVRYFFFSFFSMVDMKTASGIPDFRRQYLHHSDINNYLDFLQQKYPQMVTVNVIGCTYEGRQLKSIQISSPSSAPQKRSAPRIQSNVRKCANDRQLRPSTSVNVKRKSASNDKPVILIDGGMHLTIQFSRIAY